MIERPSTLRIDILPLPLAGDIGKLESTGSLGTLGRLIVLKTGVAPEKITPEARIVADLGID